MVGEVELKTRKKLFQSSYCTANIGSPHQSSKRKVSLQYQLEFEVKNKTASQVGKMAPKGKLVSVKSEKSGSKHVHKKEIWHPSNAVHTQKMNCALVKIIYKKNSTAFSKNWENAVDEYLKEFAISDKQLMKMVKSANKSVPGKNQRSSILRQYIAANRNRKLNGTLKDHVTQPCSVCACLIRKSTQASSFSGKNDRERKLSLRPNKILKKKNHEQNLFSGSGL